MSISSKDGLFEVTETGQLDEMKNGTDQAKTESVTSSTQCSAKSPDVCEVPTLSKSTKTTMVILASEKFGDPPSQNVLNDAASKEREIQSQRDEHQNNISPELSEKKIRVRARCYSIQDE